VTRPFLIAAVLLSLATAEAAPVTVGPLVVDDATASATLGRSTTAAAYVTIRNDGTLPDRLVAASSPQAERAGLHLSLVDGGVMRMRPVAALDIRPGETVAMAPGGALHLMLEGLRAPLRAGGTVPIILHFERAGDIEVQAEIVGPRGHEH
jgi:copper(I)-binding protein